MNSPALPPMLRKKFRAVRCISLRDLVVPCVIQHDHFDAHERVDDATGSYESLRFTMTVWFNPPANQAPNKPLEGMFNYAEAIRWIEQRQQGMLVNETMEQILDQWLDAALTYATDVNLIRMQAVIYRGDLIDADVCFCVDRYFQHTDLELFDPAPSTKPAGPASISLAGAAGNRS